MISPRATELINLLKLEPYPEGGYFREVFRSSSRVLIPDCQRERPALTTIYYLLSAGQFDSWHRVSRDEVWHFHEGDDLELFWLEQGAKTLTRRFLGETREHSRPIAVVPASCWQMARMMGDYSLVGCTVGPGFEKEDYTLLRDLQEEAGEIQRRFPELARYM